VLPPWADAYARQIRQWDGLGYTPATSSNFSGRDAAAAPRFWVSRSGVDKAAFAAADFIPVDANGHSLTTERPSAETLLHAAIYGHIPAARFVAHTHSPKLTVLSRLWLEKRHLTHWQFCGYELQKALEGETTHITPHTVPLLANSQHMPDLATQLDPWLQSQPNTPAFLISGHGLYTWASDLPALARHVTTFEFLAHCTLDCWHYGHDFSTPA
jgi:methylthioribulose-1-phosphate dehydratase